MYNKWHESAGKRIQAPILASVSFFTQSQKDDFKSRLAKDLSYTGIEMDDAILEKFIYDELKRRLGGITAYVRRSPFTSKSINATKKVIKKVVSSKAPNGKAPAKNIRHCLTCRKIGHTKVNCPKGKQTKKVNYIYALAPLVQDEEEDLEDSEEEYIVEEEDSLQEEEIEDDDVEYVEEDDSESRNCYI